MSTPIYSSLPATPVPPSVAIQIGREADRNTTNRDTCPALPWHVEDLVGTLWRNYPTGSLGRIACLGYNDLGNPVKPYFASRYSMDWKNSPGLWWGKRFVIDHWIRVDHWAPEEQLPWFGVELRKIREEIASCEQHIVYITAHWEKTSMPAENRNMAKQQLKHATERLAQAIGRLHAFAEQHRLVVAPELLNSGVESSGEPVQMTLL